MGKYGTFQKRTKMASNDRTPHAIWRGIGCSMFIILPVLSFAIAYELVNYALDNKYALPYQLLGYPQLPDFLRASSFIWSVLAPIRNTANFYAYVVFTVVVLLVLGAIMGTIYTYIYTVMGPPRYGPTDAPPPSFSPTKKSR
jgi:hypothetical protein